MPEHTSRKSRKPSGMTEKRRDVRFGVPDKCQRYLSLHIKADGSHIPAVLANFSRNGILFESSVPMETGATTECILSLSLLINRVISFRIQVRYCYKNDSSYIIGAEIDRITDHTWFDFFEEIYDFIVENKGSSQ